MYKHTTADGRKIKLHDLETSHLTNIINLIKRRAKEGITVVHGGGGWTEDDICYEEEDLFGKDVKKYYNYSKYKKELKRRRKNLIPP